MAPKLFLGAGLVYCVLLAAVVLPMGFVLGWSSDVEPIVVNLEFPVEVVIPDYDTLVEHILQLDDPPLLKSRDSVCIVSGELFMQIDQADHGPFLSIMCGVIVSEDDVQREVPYD